MEATKLAYDVSRLYLEDRRGTLPEELFSSLHGAIRARDIVRLASCFTDSVHDVTCAETARTLLQLEGFFKKNSSFADPVVTRLAALISFEEGERLCRETNGRLDDSCPEHFGDFRLEVERMQRWISSVLGDYRSFLELIPKLGSVTSGATLSRSRRKALPFLKITKKISCSPGAFPYISTLSQFFGYGEIVGKLSSSNRVAFVPKSWKTDRTIACEPEGNMFLQLAFDKYAKSRLRRTGINLSDQTKNQRLAKEGSINGELATIDLSMASDTLSYNTVCALLPGDWFQFLRSVRSSYYILYPNFKGEYAKFSSMGNGATFALETLVFAAACFAVGSNAYSVYGDDIIVESELAERLTALLAFLGFTVNKDKSYTGGPYRESCGRSYWQGVDITPRYIRELDSRKALWCHVVNLLVEISTPCGKLMEYLVRLVSDLELPLVPYNEDSMSGVFITAHEAHTRKLIRTARRGRHAWIPRVKAYKAQSWRIRNMDTRSLFLWYLYTFGREKSGRVESSWYTQSSHKYVRKWVHWYPVVGATVNLNWFSDYLAAPRRSEAVR